MMNTPHTTGKKKCSVSGCDTTGGRMFQFPNRKGNQSRFHQWILASGNKSLQNIRRDQMRSKTICIKHFERKYILNKKLSTSAVPTLYLPNSSSTNQEVPVKDKPCNENEIFGEEIFVKDGICIERESSDRDEVHMEKKTETQLTPPLQPELPDKESSNEKETFSQCANEEHIVKEEIEEQCVSSLERNIKIEPRKMEIRREIVPILKLIGVTSRKDLSPREEKLYSIIISMTKSMQQLRKSRDLMKQRLGRAEALLKRRDESS